MYERLASLLLLADDGGRFDEHPVKEFEVFDAGERAVAGDDFYSGGQLRDNLADVLRHPQHVAAVFKVNERKFSGEEIIAHVNDVRVREIFCSVSSRRRTLS